MRITVSQDRINIEYSYEDKKNIKQMKIADVININLTIKRKLNMVANYSKMGKTFQIHFHMLL